MRIVLHGGMHKTGTTSVQQFLAEHRAELLTQGFCYPGQESQHGVAFNFRQISGLSPEIANLIEEARIAGAHTLVLSGEVISTLREDEWVRLRASLADHDLQFVFCFRHWSTYLPSRWAQYCSRRDSMTLDDYLVITGPGCEFVDRRFDLVLERALVHGPVIAVSYDNAMAHDGSALPATLRAIGLPDRMVTAGALATTRYNARPDWAFSEIVRLLNGSIAHRRGLPLDELYPTLAESRPTCTLFDYAQPIAALPSDLLSALHRIVTAHRVQRIIERAETAPMEAILNERYRGLFINRIDDQVFMTVPPSSTATCTLTAKEFRDRYSEVSNTALAELHHLWDLA